MIPIKVTVPDTLGDRLMFRHVHRAAERAGIVLEAYGHRRRQFADVLVSRGMDIKIAHTDATVGIDLSKYLKHPVHPLERPAHLAAYQALLISEETGVPLGLSVHDLRPTWESGSAIAREKLMAQNGIFIPEKAAVIFPYSTSSNRNPANSFWESLACAVRNRFRMIQVVAHGEHPIAGYLQVPAPPLVIFPDFLRAVEDKGGYVITLDSFPLHAAGTAGVRNAILVATSSNPSALLYPSSDMAVVTGCRIGEGRFTCGLHGYGNHVGEIKEKFGLDTVVEGNSGCRRDLIDSNRAFSCILAMEYKVEEVIALLEKRKYGVR